jgi:hypothetical protein
MKCINMVFLGLENILQLDCEDAKSSEKMYFIFGCC